MMDTTIAPMSDAARREAVRPRFPNVDTSNVADVLDSLRYPDQGLAADLHPIRIRRAVWSGGPTPSGDK
jgi:hypothetical protein